MLKVGVIGVGGISGAHISAWRSMDDAELVALCDIRESQMQQYDGVRKYTDMDEMLEKETFDIIDICLPSYMHADVSIKVLEKGINVICEKPISLNVADVERIYSTAKKNNVMFMIAQVLRFWREYEILKQIYDTQKYGKLLSGSMTRLSAYPKWSWDNWMFDESRSGLVPFDLHIHDLDFMIYMLGKPNGATVNRTKGADKDYIHATYQYDDFFVNIEAAWFACDYPFRAEFRFQFEDAIVANECGQFTIYKNDGTAVDMSADTVGETGEINLPKSDAYANEIRYFADCVKNNTEPDKVKPCELETVIGLIDKYIRK